MKYNNTTLSQLGNKQQLFNQKWYCTFTHAHASINTGLSKKRTQFYYWDNFGNSAPILTILSLLQAEIYGA